MPPKRLIRLPQPKSISLRLNVADCTWQILTVQERRQRANHETPPSLEEGVRSGDRPGRVTLLIQESTWPDQGQGPQNSERCLDSELRQTTCLSGNVIRNLRYIVEL